MNEIEIQELISKIYSHRRKHQVEALLLEELLTYNMAFPFATNGITVGQFFKFKKYLTELGIETNFYMGTGPSNAFWQLAPNAFSGYVAKKRKETIDEIINS